MEAKCSTETLVGFQRTTRLYIPEDITAHNQSYENFKSCKGDINLKICMHDIEAEGSLLKGSTR
jgi:hypothetical protein